MDTKYPLAIPVKAGMDVIKKFKLRSETSLRDDIKNYQDFSEVYLVPMLLLMLEGKDLTWLQLMRRSEIIVSIG